MRGNDFLEKMGLIDPAYVEAADTATNKKKIPWKQWGAIAACFAVIVVAATMLFPHDEPELPSDLPMLSISENTSGGMGYEGYMAYDISELVNANPWKNPRYPHSLSIKTSCTTMSTILHQERILIKCGSLSWMLLGDWDLIQAT